MSHYEKSIRHQFDDSSNKINDLLWSFTHNWKEKMNLHVIFIHQGPGPGMKEHEHI